MYLNHNRGFSDRSARIGNNRSPVVRPLPYALIAVGCALVLFIAAVGYVNRSVDVELNGQKTGARGLLRCRISSTNRGLTDTLRRRRPASRR